MKLLRAFAVLFLFPFFSQSQFPVSPNKLDEKGRRTGHWTLLFDSAFRKELKNPDSARYYRLLRYEAGIPTGKVRDFYRTGQKQWEGYLLSMIPDVIDVEGINYHENGKVKYKAVYVKGKFDGPFAEYSVNGKLLEEME